jgi:UDP-glucose 4-epimerase
LFSFDNESRVIVTGCAGFIGSNFLDSLLDSGAHVIGIDNFQTGKKEFLENALRSKNFTLHDIDLLSTQNLQSVFEKVDLVFHFAANADVRFGAEHPRRDLEQNVIVTHNILEAMRLSGTSKIVFASTGSVYGDAEVIPTPENAPFPIQTSLYGASKLACEGLITAYVEAFGMQAWIFRFVSILGPRYTHGHVYDFYQQLMKDPKTLTVLGNGHQKKSYLHVSDCIRAIYISLEKSLKPVNVINLGVDGYCEVRDSVEWITSEMRVNPEIYYGTEPKGWIGDNPLIHLDTKRILGLGWSPRYSIEEAVRDTVSYMDANQWIFTGNANE